MMLTQEKLKSRLKYNKKTGVFTRNIKFFGKEKGTAVGGARKDGYFVIVTFGKHYLAHRLAWLYVKGYFPKGDIDHIDGDPRNNAWSNLRESSRRENLWNSRVRIDSTSGIKGVRFHKASQLFNPRVTVNGKTHSLGYYKDIKIAEKVIKEARLKLYGDFARHK